MARYDHIPLFKSAYGLCLETYKVTRNFGREYKYTLGEKMKDASHDMLDLTIETNSLPNQRKIDVLEKLLLKTEKYRMYGRLACDLKIIPIKRVGEIAEKIEEISKQSQGWKNWLEKNPEAKVSK